MDLDGINFDPTPQRKQKPPKPKPYTSFPTHLLPSDLGDYIKASADAIGCDEGFVALPCLAVSAAAIGNSRRIMLKRRWYEPSVLWAVTIGESGTQKSPANDAATSPTERWQRESFDRHAEAMADYDRKKVLYDREKKRQKTGEPPVPPEIPICERFIVSDTTIEGLVPILQENLRGVLLAREELAGWLGSFDKYSSGKSGDSAHWLSMHAARSLTVDRKTGDKRTLHVPQAAVSIVGTIQPGVLNRALGTEHRESGLLARLLVVYPPRSPKRWTEREVSEKVEAVYVGMLDDLRRLEMEVSEDGRRQPGLIRLKTGAKELFAEFVNRHGEESAELSGDLAAAYSKLEGTAARFALIFSLIEGETEVSASSMSNAIELVEWFKSETARVYSLFGESDDDREDRELAEWIERKGGSVTVRELTRGPRRFRGNDDEAEVALNGLVKAGFGEWRVANTAGRQRREFWLATPATVTQVAETAETGASVTVATVTAEQNTKNWGTV